MEKKILRWGVIGTGDVTERKSAPSFNKIRGSQLLAVGNRNPEKAEDYALRHGIPTWHRDPFDVIHNPQVDVVYVATPPGSHMEYALECIQAGKPVYLEKPMARNWDECELINEAAQKRGVAVYVAYYRRSLEYFLKIKEIIDGGSLGKILSVNLQQFFPARREDYQAENLPWRVIPKESGGGYFHDMGCHALDILFFIFGDPLEVAGKTSNRGGLYDPADTLSASLLLPDNLLVNGSWSFVTPEPFQKDLVEIIGEKGKLEFSVFEFNPIIHTIGTQSESHSIAPPENIQMPFIQSIVSEMMGKGKCPSTGKSAAVTSKVMDIISGRI